MLSSKLFVLFCIKLVEAALDSDRVKDISTSNIQGKYFPIIHFFFHYQTEMLMKIRNFFFAEKMQYNSTTHGSTRPLYPSAKFCNPPNDKFLILYLVTSEPSNYERRKLIRTSWGKVDDVDGFESRVIFLMGRDRLKQRKSMRSPKIATNPKNEVIRYLYLGF